MEKRRETEKKNNHSVRKKWKRVIAVALSALMVSSVIDYSGFINVNAQTQSENKTINAFAELAEDVRNQQIAKGTSEADIHLPDTLNVTVKSIVTENADTVMESVENNAQSVPEVVADETTVETVEESTLENEVPNSVSNQQEVAETVTVESSENNAALPTQSVEELTQDTTETEPVTKEVTEDVTLDHITWKINASLSSSDTFNSESAGVVFYYEPVLPEGYSLADGVSLPQIQVQIEDNSKWTFSQSQTIDGIEITVKAEKDVFPAGAVLHAKKVTNTEDNEKIQSAVNEEVQSEDTAKSVAELVSFDITITDADGNELQPDTGKGEVKVSFAQLPMVTENTAPTQELKVFHMDDSLNNAQGLDTTVDQKAGTLEAPAEHFTVYTAALLTATAEDGEASVTDSSNAVTYYDTVKAAITAAQGLSGSTVTLLKDVATESAVTVSSGTFTIDLHGMTWVGPSGDIALKFTYSPNVTFVDSVGGGEFTSSYSYVVAVYSQSATVALYGGKYKGIGNVASGGTIGALLAGGYAYKNSDGTWVSDVSGSTITNVTVTPAPVKITAQPEDTIAELGYTAAPTLSVTAETVPAGSGKTISYKWYKDSVAIDGATNANYTVDSGLAEGTYTYYCAVTSDGYTVNTNNATFYVSSSTGNYEVTASNGITFKYPTLETAITAAKSKPGSTVKLLDNATTTSMVTVGSGTFTIDLNGKTWTSNAVGTAGVSIQLGSHVTFKDSDSGGKYVSSADYVIFINNADVTIENGIYESTSTGGNVVFDASISSDYTLTIKEGTFINDGTGYLLVQNRMKTFISGGTFDRGTACFSNSQSVSFTGGSFDSIACVSGNVGTLLASGYGYKGDTWVNDTSGTSLSNVTVQPAPAKITAQPQNASATYGYTSAPAMSVTAETTSVATGGISYQWYVDGTAVSGATNASGMLPTGLDAGTHSFYCAVSCDGYIVNSQSAAFTVDRKDVSTGTLALDIPVDGYTYDGTEKIPAVTFTLDGHALVLSTDYIFDYMDNTNAGTASIMITGVGNYIGTKSREFTIAKATPNITLDIVGGGENGELMYGKSATYTVHVTGINGEALTDATIVGINLVSANGSVSSVGYTMSYNSEKGAYFVSNPNFNDEQPGTFPFYAIAVFPEGSDTSKNYVLGEDSEIKTAKISKTVQKADTSIAFNSSYTGNYFYTGSPITNPTSADLSITGASYSDVVFTWYDSNSNQLDIPPTTPGSYILAVSIPENDYFKSSSNTKSVTISSYDGTVAPAYNGNTTKAEWYSADVAITADGYTVSDSMDGTYAESYLLSGEGAVNKTLYFKQNGTGYITDGKTITVNIDKTAPLFLAETDGININDNSWKGFLNQITFGHFFKENKDVNIAATDSGSGVAKYYYYIDTTGSTTVKTADELNVLSFTEGASFSITDEHKYVIYAYAVDVAGNKSAYICTDGIVIDKTAPIVTLTAPAGSDLRDVSGAAKVQMNETGMITYVIKNSEQSGITAQDILAATDKKTVSVTDGHTDTTLDAAFSGLTANTTYYMYAVGIDSAQNNGSVVNTSFTTTTTQPVFAGNPTITGTYGQQVKDMTVSQPASTNGVDGSWSVSSTDKPTVGTSATYDVVFTPTDAVHYATVAVSVTPTITRKSLTAAGVTIGVVSDTYTYDGTAKVPTVTVTDSTATITSSDYEYSYSNNTGAGTATVTVTGKGNYTGTVNRTFTIAKASAPNITYPAASGITYGQKLSASALTGGSTEYGSFAWTNGNTVPTVTNSGYEVTFTPNPGTVANYEAIINTTGSVSVSVSKATPATTVNAVVSDDAGSRKATLTATITGVGNGENPTGTVKFINNTSGSDVDLAGAIEVSITGGTATYIWTGLANQIYKVKVVYSGSGNYNTATSSELSFDTSKQNQAALSIGNIGTKTYGDGTFTLSATGGSGGGAVTFKSADPTILSISGTTATIHKAGTVTITATKATDSTYNEATASVALTVGKKTLTVKADNKPNIIKGVAMPALTYTATGLVGSDTFTSPTVSVAAADTNTVGEYDIMINGGTLTNADSYAVTYTNGKLTVVNATYNVTVTYGTGDGNYSEGQTVTITADSRSGYTFTGWSSSDGVTFANSTASTTTFAMLEKAVTVTANYSKNSSGDNGNTNGGSTSNNNNDTTNQNTTNNGSTTDNTTGTGTNQTVKETTQGGKVQQTDNLGRTEENQPYLSGDKGKSGWDAIITEVDESIDEEATEPVPLTVEMNGATIIPANVISQLRGKNVKLILNMGNGITWTINGMDVEDTELSDIDLGVTRNTSVIPEDVVNGIRGENSSIQIELAHKGAFGFTATLSIAFDSTDAGKYANLFYYNEETGKLEYMESAQVSEDGTATLTFVHASAYSIVLSSAKMDESSITASESKGNNQANDNSKTVTTEVQATDETSGSMMVIWILLGVIVVVVIAGTTIYMKKKKDDKEENEA